MLSRRQLGSGDTSSWLFHGLLKKSADDCASLHYSPLQPLFHLNKELIARETFAGLPVTDFILLSGDIKRVYRILLLVWLSYMQFLKQNYPSLFSLVMRRNAFDQNASVVILC
jgi:hypothetical protein